MPLQFSPETPIRRSAAALWRPFDHETAVILPTVSSVRVLNEVGARIWELADGRTLAQIVDTLVNEYDVERTQLEEDARAFLSELQDRGLLEGIPDK